MAIGVRIKSDNLNGKTASVSFVPSAGSPDGTGSVDLGTKTIPFNNINTYPYGVYSLYFAEYDYTYNIVVDNPTGQTFVFVSQMAGDTYNYGAAYLNFNDLTAEVMDLGIDSSVWNLENFYPITNKGYAYFYNEVSNNSSKRVVFTNFSNDVIGDYSGVSSDWSYDVLDGKWIIVVDQDAGVAYYSNGESSYSYNWNTSTYQFDFDWNNYAVTSDGSLIFYLSQQDETVTSYAISYNNVITQLEVWNNSLLYKNYFQSPTHNFVPSLTYDGVTNLYTILIFKDTNGTQLDSVSLTGSTYDNYSYEQYGLNKFVIVFWKNSDINIDYKIVHFDGNTNVTIETSHTRGEAFENIQLQARDNNGDVRAEISKSLLIVFFTNGNYTNMGQDSAYVDMMYMLGNQTAFTPYTFINNQNGTFINTWQVRTNLDFLFLDGDAVLKILSLTNSGAQITTTSIPAHPSNYSNTNRLGDIGTLFSIYANGQATDSNYIHFRSHNNYDVLQMVGNDNYTTCNNSAFVTTNSTSYYINTTTEGFTSFSGSYGSDRRNDEGYTATNLMSDAFVIYDYQSNPVPARILTSTSLSNEVLLPQHNGSYEIQMGKDYMLYVYSQPDTNLTIAKLYDRTMSLVKTLTTDSISGWNDITVVEDRFVVIIPGDGIRKVYMISPTLTPYATLSHNNNYRYTPNDYVYYNNVLD